MRFLLVDDSRTMRNIEKKVLSGMPGAEFFEAGDGVEALSVIASQPAGFGMILVDWNMPNMDGITLVGRIREKDKTTPLVMVTTEAEKGRVLEAIRAGVNNYVIKPFTPEALLEKVNQTLARIPGAMKAA